MTTTQPTSNHGPAVPPQDPPANSTPNQPNPSTVDANDEREATRVPLIQPDEITPANAGTDSVAEQATPPAAESDWTQLKDSPETAQPGGPTELFTGSEAVPANAPQWLTDLRAKYENSALPGMLLAAGVIALVFVMMRRLARKPKAAPEAAHDERIGAIREQALASITPLERSLAEAEELTRRLAATLDNKADRIDLLIQEADRKLDELNRANATVARQTPLPATDRPARPQRAIDPSLMDRARVEQDRAERDPEPSMRPQDPQPTQDRAETDERQPIHHRVWALADDGVPTVEIAQSLNQPVGQVELILNLRKSG